MKNILLVLFFIPLFSFSQEGFEFIYEDSTSTGCVSSFLDNEGYIISVGSSRDLNTGIIDVMILKFQTPEDIMVKKINSNGDNYTMRFGFQKENGNYFLIGIDLSSNAQIYLLEVNQELEPLQETYYTVPGGYAWIEIQDAFEDDDNTIILSGLLYDQLYQILGIFVTRVNKSGTVLKTTITTECKNTIGAEFLKKKDGSGYLLLGTFQYNIVSFDNDLNITGYSYFPSGQNFNSPIGVRWLPDGNLMFVNMANQGVPGAYYDIRVRKVDDDYYTIKDTTFFDDGKNRVPMYSGLDYVDPGNIWIASFHQTWKSSKDEWERARVYIVDSDLNFKGAKYFAGDKEVCLYTIKALEDGGCIITGNVVKDGKMDDYNVYLRKIMPDDIFTNAEETLATDDSDVLLFPNPVKDVLYIETYRKDLSISLYDGNGKCVTGRRELHIPDTDINVSRLPGGVYFYSVFDKGKVIETGKIIKQSVNH